MNDGNIGDTYTFDMGDQPSSGSGGSGLTASGALTVANIIVGTLMVMVIITAIILIITGGVEQGKQNGAEDDLKKVHNNHIDLLESIIAIVGQPWESHVTGGRPAACDKSVIIKFDIKHDLGTA